MRFPQYAKTTHGEVLHAIQENNATYDEFVKHVSRNAEYASLAFPVSGDNLALMAAGEPRWPRPQPKKAETNG